MENIELEKLALERKRLEEETELRKSELKIQREQFEASKKGRWTVSPIMVAILAGIVGLFGTILGGILNIAVERQKLEGSLILEGIKTGDNGASARNLLFFYEAGLIRLSSEQISKLEAARKASGGSTIPVLPPEQVSFNSSSALTPDLEKKLSATVKSFQTYSKNLGFTISSDKVAISIVPGFDTGSGGAYQGQIAYYDQTDKSIVVATEYADDENIVLRQYAHHLLVTANDATANAKGYNAIESGLATYFPCSFTKSPMLGSNSRAAAKGRFRPQNLVNTRKFSEISLDDWTSVQLDGSEIWGAAFWDINQLLGQELADKVLFSTWVHLKSAPKQVDPYRAFADALLEIDKSLEGSVHTADLKAVFNRRGLA